jgi:VanZ family protein
VGAADEYYQSFIPSREGSIGDVLLDILGVVLVRILARRIPPLLWMNALKKLKKWASLSDIKE